MMPGTGYLLGIVATLAAGTLMALVFRKSPRAAGRISILFILVALCLAVGLALWIEATKAPVQATLGRVPFLDSAITLRVDWLSLLLLLAVLFVALWAALFSLDYIPSLKREPSGWFYPVFMLLLLSICGVLCAWDLLLFFAAWEFMSLPMFLLIIYQDDQRRNLRAGLKYLVLTGTANLGMLAAILVIYAQTHSFALEDVRAGLGMMTVTRPWAANLVLALFALAFATKAGLPPTGDWAPDAYPAAPSSASAVLSGVMSKLGPYGVMRVFLWLLPAQTVSPTWLEGWGLVLATWGVASILLGSSAAVACNEGKRLLAYSSISQSGYIFLGIGVALAALPTAPSVAALALVACVVHILVDAFQKSALFLTTGSVIYRTGTCELNELGGLEDRMPSTTLAALGGALSLAGLPLGGAFVSKWLLIQAALWTGVRSAWFIACAVAALIGSVLAAAYGLKYVGAIFLGPESRLVSRLDRAEVPPNMRLAQGLLTVCCFVVGILPVLVIRPILAALPDSLAAAGQAAFADLSLSRLVPLTGMTPTATLAPLWLVGLLALAIAGAWMWSRSGSAAVREVPGWACGEDLVPDDMRPRGGGYFWVLSRYLGQVYGQIGVPPLSQPGEPYDALDADHWGFDRVVRCCLGIGRQIGRWHSGLTQHYVLWQLLGALIIAAIVLSVAR